ncbi:N-acetyltransferase [bacterium]|nr:N-acetyltransferase [bacterium]
MSIRLDETPTGGRYAAMEPGGPEAEMTFSKAGAHLIIIDHTAVPAAYAGRGVGRALVERAVTDARTRGWKIIPLCPFAKATLEKHAEWRDVVHQP